VFFSRGAAFRAASLRIVCRSGVVREAYRESRRRRPASGPPRVRNPRPTVGRILRAHAREIFRAALKECAPDAMLGRRFRRQGTAVIGPDIRMNLRSAGRVFVMAYGKAAGAMARAFLGLLASPGAIGCAVLPAWERGGMSVLRSLRAAHPVPDRSSFRAGRALLSQVARAREGDRVVHLISGGGSAMAAAPLRGLLGEEEKSLLHALLIGSGLGIQEMNVVRKHFSDIKGGRLLLTSPKASHISLILSDVPSGCLEAVAGGPTFPDRSSWAECLGALEGAGALSELPARLRARLDRGGLPETPKPGDARFRKHRWALVASAEDLVAAAARRAADLGYRVRVVPSSIEETPEGALNRLLRLSAAAGACREPLCAIGSGEVRPRVRGGRGRLGGRAQDLAAAAAERLAGEPACLFFAAGSDGIDGNSPAAGAMADGRTVSRGRKRGMDVGTLRREGNTYALFRALGDSVMTGPTGNNLRDLYFLLERPRKAPSLRAASGNRRGS
jgi:glycerate 2-kinase